VREEVTAVARLAAEGRHGQAVELGARRAGAGDTGLRMGELLAGQRELHEVGEDAHGDGSRGREDGGPGEEGGEGEGELHGDNGPGGTGQDKARRLE
jgi:hypothetical protein